MAAMLGKALLTITRPLQPLMPRMSPKLIIIGAQKAGTTTLFDLLSQHPKVIPPAVKEIDFFSSDERYGAGLTAYWKSFPRRPVAMGRHITLEASPSYLMSPVAAQRIARHLPKALCLAVLRDPVSRAYSAWNMYHQFKGGKHHRFHDPRTFEQAVADELEGKPCHAHHAYLANSTYAPQVERFIDHVGASALLVRSFHELTRDPQALVNDVLTRLGIETFPAGHPAFATRSNARAYPSAIPADLAALLHAHFEPDLRALEGMVGHALDIVDAAPQQDPKP